MTKEREKFSVVMIICFWKTDSDLKKNTVSYCKAKQGQLRFIRRYKITAFNVGCFFRRRFLFSLPDNSGKTKYQSFIVQILVIPITDIKLNIEAKRDFATHCDLSTGIKDPQLFRTTIGYVKDTFRNHFFSKKSKPGWQEFCIVKNRNWANSKKLTLKIDIAENRMRIKLNKLRMSTNY